MSAIKKDLIIEQGADWTEDFIIDIPTSLIGAKAAMQIRTKYGATFIASLTPENSGLLINPATNVITASILHDKNSNYVPETYVYDIKVTDAGGTVYRVYQGDVCISGEVTIIDPVGSAGIPLTTETGEEITTEDGTPIST